MTQIDSPANIPTPYSKSFYPFTNPPAGTALSSTDWPQNEKLPLLFTPITIGKDAKMTFKNRIFLAPLVVSTSWCRLG